MDLHDKRISAYNRNHQYPGLQKVLWEILLGFQILALGLNVSQSICKQATPLKMMLVVSNGQH